MANRATTLARLALVDAHCHIHDARFGTLQPILRRAVAANVTRLVACACHHADWDALESLLARWHDTAQSAVTHPIATATSTNTIEQQPAIHLTPSFGVHPWWANEATGDYLEHLRTKLLQHLTASVGEIGLCKSARGQAVAASVQETAFSEQLALATTLERTVVIHCVGRYGRLLELLLASLATSECKALPPRIVLHSYAGGAPLVASLVALERKAPNTRVFFSLNAKQLSNSDSTGTTSKAAVTCAAIPLRSLLLETDAPDQAPDDAVFCDALASLGDVVVSSDESDRAERPIHNEPALVAVAYARAAAIRQLALEDLAAAVYDNAACAFGVI